MKNPLMLTPVLLFLLMVAGCSEHADTQMVQENGMVKGIAKVVDINEDIASVTLEIDGKTVRGYWELEHSLAQGGTVVQNGPMKSPVGDYHEPIVQRQGFPAQLGDTIVFVGMRTGQSIFLRGVQVVGQ